MREREREKIRSIFASLLAWKFKKTNKNNNNNNF